MELAEAWQVLGLDPGTAAPRVRSAYRQLLRTHHPDVAGPAGESTTRRLIEAFEAWRHHGRTAVDGAGDGTGHGTGTGTEVPGPDSPEPVAVDPIEQLLLVVDGDTLHVPFPARETFLELLRAAHEIGDVTYIDRDTELLEALLRVEDGAIVSVVLSLQGRADGTDVFFTLEPLEAGRVVPLHVEDIVTRFAEVLARP